MYYLLISFKFMLYIEFVGSSERPQDTIKEEGDRGEGIPLKKRRRRRNPFEKKDLSGSQSQIYFTIISDLLFLKGHKL